jgi:hypothetical protein
MSLNKLTERHNAGDRQKPSSASLWERQIWQSHKSSVLDRSRLCERDVMIITIRNSSEKGLLCAFSKKEALVASCTWPKSGGFETSSCDWSAGVAPPSLQALIPLLQSSTTLFFFFFYPAEILTRLYTSVDITMCRGEGAQCQLHCRIVRWRSFITAGACAQTRKASNSFVVSVRLYGHFILGNLWKHVEKIHCG